jgi:hypothetical protein
MTARRLDAAAAYAPRLEGTSRVSRRSEPRLPQGPAEPPQPKDRGERVPAGQVRVGMAVRGLPYWGAHAGRWLRVNAVVGPDAHGMLAVFCEGGRWMGLRAEREVEALREESHDG